MLLKNLKNLEKLNNMPIKGKSDAIAELSGVSVDPFENSYANYLRFNYPEHKSTQLPEVVVTGQATPHVQLPEVVITGQATPRVQLPEVEIIASKRIKQPSVANTPQEQSTHPSEIITINPITQFKEARKQQKIQSGKDVLANQDFMKNVKPLVLNTDPKTSYWNALASQKLGQNKTMQDVMNLQEKLIKNGYLKGNADGKWGKQTQAAYDAYQADEKKVAANVELPEVVITGQATPSIERPKSVSTFEFSTPTTQGPQLKPWDGLHRDSRGRVIFNKQGAKLIKRYGNAIEQFKNSRKNVKEIDY